MYVASVMWFFCARIWVVKYCEQRISNWPFEEVLKSILKTFCKTFWLQLVCTAFLAVTKLSMTCVGQFLIQRIVEYSEGTIAFAQQGYTLALLAT